MNAIRISKRIDSETLHLPELKPLIGKRVEIIVREEAPPPSNDTGPYDVLARLGQLPSNWDGYGSPPVQASALASARKLVAVLAELHLPVPSVCPVTGGGIGFTWQSGNREVEIEILPDGSAQYLTALPDGASGTEATQSGGLSLDAPEQVQRLAALLIG